MLCIDLTKLFIIISWGLAIFNFIAIIIIICLAKGWNRTADKVFYQRRWGIFDNDHYRGNNEIDDIEKQIEELRTSKISKE